MKRVEPRLVRMSTALPEPSASPEATALRDRWKAGSLELVWSRPGDWYDPAVDALAEAVASGHDPVPAAQRLGEARGEQGVGLSEALDDLTALYLAAGIEHPPMAAVRALAEAWADAGIAPMRNRACEDPLTGHATPSYLRMRVKETYARSRRTGLPVGQAYCLVVVDAELSEAHAWQRMARSCVLGAALMDVFDGGDPVAAMPGGRFVVLARRDDELNHALARLRLTVEDRVDRAGLGEAVRRPLRIWVEGLPADAQVALQLLDEFER